MTASSDGPETFKVELVCDDDEYSVFTHTWHNHFDSFDEAQDMLLRLLTPFCRVVAEQEGETRIGSYVEYFDADGWSGGSSLVGPSRLEPVVVRGPVHVTRYQQNLIPAEDFVEPTGLKPDELPPETVLGKTTF